jgi:hypothetical protein
MLSQAFLWVAEFRVIPGLNAKTRILNYIESRLPDILAGRNALQRFLCDTAFPAARYVDDSLCVASIQEHQKDERDSVSQRSVRGLQVSPRCF